MTAVAYPSCLLHLKRFSGTAQEIEMRRHCPHVDYLIAEPALNCGVNRLFNPGVKVSSDTGFVTVIKLSVGFLNMDKPRKNVGTHALCALYV
jgi:hypothetical protein